eukprot:TRINITY_DN17630_c0_g1_i1.p1 TRINITY_DN17630_c0_g1~~TRINITY_DN17630_c0_g1_i1.p1  ORF type:complete len:353 (+),score=50.68 TRINITY_DN17630_c0_g1_i1:65-1060(+)
MLADSYRLRRRVVARGVVVACFFLCSSAEKDGEEGSLHERHMRQVQKGLDRKVRHVPARSFTREEWEYMGKCPYWLNSPNYYDRWKTPTARNIFRTLYDVYRTTCTKKPNGAMEHIAFVNTDAALAEIERAGEEAWYDNTMRQDSFAVHNNTQSLLLLWKANSNLFEATKEHPKWPIWKPILEPVLRAACDHYGYNYDEIDVYKAMLARLPPNASVSPHADTSPCLAIPHRLHWVVSGEEGVNTYIGKEQINIENGQLFEFNNVRVHSVENRGPHHRIHAIFDVHPKRLPDDARVLKFFGDYDTLVEYEENEEYETEDYYDDYYSGQSTEL